MNESCYKIVWFRNEWRIVLIFLLFWGCVGNSSREKSETKKPQPTVVSIQDGKWYLNGSVTYPGTPSEGLLMNARMVNATFEDRNRTDFDPDANTNRFISKIPEYVAQGIRSFTFNLQGGTPGYEGAINSAFHADGNLRSDTMKRMQRVIDACDRNGCVAILGCFYQRQDQILQDANAVRVGLLNVIDWLIHQKYRHVVLEVANEFNHGGFDHPIINTVKGEVKLIQILHQAAPGLLISTSGLGDGRIPDEIAQASDFILIHFNGTPVNEIPERIQSLKRFNKPIVCNEDEKTGEEAAGALDACVQNGASWGYMNLAVNQTFPFRFNGVQDDPIMYGKLKEITMKH